MADNSDRIRRLLMGNMDSQERSAFIKELNASPDLQEEFKIHEALMLALQENASAEALQGDNTSQQTSSPRPLWKPIYSIAAAVIVLIAIGILIRNTSNTYQKEQLFAEAFVPQNVAPDFAPRAIDSVKTSRFQQAMVLLKAKEYPKVIEILSAFSQADSGIYADAQIHLIQAYLGLEQPQPDKAAARLEEVQRLINTNDPRAKLYERGLDWYLVLINLQQGEFEEARQLLQTNLENGTFGEDQQELLDKMNSLWFSIANG